MTVSSKDYRGGNGTSLQRITAEFRSPGSPLHEIGPLRQPDTSRHGALTAGAGGHKIGHRCLKIERGNMQDSNNSYKVPPLRRIEGQNGAMQSRSAHSGADVGAGAVPTGDSSTLSDHDDP